MDTRPDAIVRRDFPRARDGYDPAVVDSHLEAVAAALGHDSAAAAARPVGARSAAEVELLAAGRRLLGQISALRVELKDVSASLREQSFAISDALEELLDLDGAPPPAPGPSGGPGSEAGHVSAGPLVPPEADAGGQTDATPPPMLPAAGAARVDAATLTDARLVALDLALGGSDRDEITRELAGRFDLPDPVGLVDEVLARLG